MAEMRSCSEQTLIDMLKDYRARTGRSAFDNLDNLAEPEPACPASCQASSSAGSS